MRAATNSLGHEVQVHTPAGWRAVAFAKPYPTREMAGAAMTVLQAAAPGDEFRVYECLEPRK